MERKQESVADVRAWFVERIGGLFPAGLGSLSLRRTRCIRQRCHACATGERHVSYVLSGRSGGRRFSLYIPDVLAQEVEQALVNGRAFQELLYEATRRYAAALKREGAGKAPRR